MDREEILNTALNIHSNSILLELPTGTGKTYIALSIVQDRLKDVFNKSILIVIPKLVLKNEWLKEIHKWGMDDLIPCITFSTYVSFPKHNLNSYYSIIYDEGHHLTDRCIEHINLMNLKNFPSQVNIILSATIKPSHRVKLLRSFCNLQIYKVKVKEAIDNDILPDPTVLLIPLRLDKSKPTQTYIKGVNNKNVLNCNYANRWPSLKIYYKNSKSIKLQIACSEYEYYELLNHDIDTATKNCREGWKNHLLGDRLKWLSSIKTPMVKQLLKILSNYRTLTFCNSIEQCEQLGKHPIHSGKKELKENLEKFNNKEINHITACNVLDEGINAVDLRIGIYANINSSTIKVKQRLGRCLRHKKPVIIIPYYEDTREEEIVNKMKEDFTPENIHVIHYLNEIKSYLK
jgi:superfamily II DNA or RNA helicase